MRSAYLIDKSDELQDSDNSQSRSKIHQPSIDFCFFVLFLGYIGGFLNAVHLISDRSRFVGWRFLIFGGMTLWLASDKEYEQNHSRSGEECFHL